MATTSFIESSLRSKYYEYSIVTENLVKVYGKGPLAVRAVDGISLEIKKGEFISVVGPSGSGKSTLLNLLGLLDKPSEGKLFIDGKDVSGLSQNEAAMFRNKKIGFVFQSYNLINRLTALQNVELPLIASGVPKQKRVEKAKFLLNAVGLKGKEEKLPTMLSGGEQQRVAIARALVNEPSVILADEPTGNLDSKSAKMIVDLLSEINKKFGSTIVIVTHNMEVADATQKIVMLRDGKVEKIVYSGGAPE
ncbi:MAG: ABC transporter ATP-binding protein [Thermoproteota archaeon]